MLKELKIMDYSMLVGLHLLEKGNSERIRNNTLSLFKPQSQEEWVSHGSKAEAMKRMIVESDPVALGPGSAQLPVGSFFE